MKLSYTFLFILLSVFCYAQWTQLSQNINGEMAGDESGYKVSMSSDGLTVAISSIKTGEWAGHVRIYKMVDDAWVQQGQDLDGEFADDQFGEAISISSDGLTIAIGSSYYDGNGNNSGRVKVFTFVGGSWEQLGQNIEGELSWDRFGRSVSISSDGLTIAAGAIYNNISSNNSGYIKLFKFIDGSWQQQGQTIYGEAIGDSAGESLSMSSDGLTVAISSNKNEGWTGHVRVFTLIGGIWEQQGQDIDGEASSDQSGVSISMSSDGSTVAIGAPNNDGNGNNSGHVRVYKLTGGIWVQQGQDIDGEAALDTSGKSVSLSADGLKVAIGAPQNDGNAFGAGHVRIYKLVGTNWEQFGEDIDGEFYNDLSGTSVSLSSNGSKVAISSILNDENGQKAGQVKIFNFCTATSSDFNVTTCDSYTVPSGNTTYTAIGTYTVMDTIQNQGLCDSLMTISLTILPELTGSVNTTVCSTDSIIVNSTTYNALNPNGIEIITGVGPYLCDSTIYIDLNVLDEIDSSINLTGSTITANQSGANYQWIDCNNGNEPILGAMSPAYSPSISGSYAVVITDGVCSVTSDCAEVILSDVREKKLDTKFIVYPNPTPSSLVIEFESIQKNLTIRLLSVLGQTLDFFQVKNSDSIELEIKEPSGIYLVEIANNDNKSKTIFKVVKK